MLSIALFLDASASDPGDGFELVEIADGVFVHRGQYADLDDPARADSANIGFIVGERCVAVVDTGGSIVTGRRMRAAIAERAAKPVCYVINTHVHFDHVLGNAAFSGDSPEFVGHVNLKNAMAGNVNFFQEQFAAELGTGGSVVGPTVTVEDTLSLDLGNRTLLLAAHPPAHTNTDLTVLDTTTGTLWAGDLIFIERLPVLDASLKGWLRWIDEQTGEGYARVVPGHGPSGGDWETSVSPLKNYLLELLNQTRAAIANGVFMEDALNSVAKSSAASWQLNDRHPRNVSRAYRELEWE